MEQTELRNPPRQQSKRKQGKYHQREAFLEQGTLFEMVKMLTFWEPFTFTERFQSENLSFTELSMKLARFSAPAEKRANTPNGVVKIISETFNESSRCKRSKRANIQTSLTNHPKVFGHQINLKSFNLSQTSLPFERKYRCYVTIYKSLPFQQSER